MSSFLKWHSLISILIGESVERTIHFLIIILLNEELPSQTYPFITSYNIYYVNQ